jgi:hypothetical protein
MILPRPDGSIPGRARRLAATGLVPALALILLTLPACRRAAMTPPPPDPRAAYAGPFRNIDPAVRYVADARCADCHEDIARAFAAHPMGRSLLPMARAARVPEDARHHNPFDALGSRFLVGRDGGRAWQRRVRLGPDGRSAAVLEWDVAYVIGSGTRGHSYLTDRGGYLFQTPASWFAQKQAWHLSPGFGPPLLTGRPVEGGCLFCHANRAHFVEGSVNHYAEPVFDGHAIGCQRCHGPGEVHVTAREAGKPVPGPVDRTIVNPRHLEPALREAVCEQCHLEGIMRVPRRGRGLYDYRPGLPLDRFWSVFLAAPGTGEGARAVGHVEQLHQSRCFRGSPSGQLGCISCHDPHRTVPPERRVAYYRDRCLQCHDAHGCGLPAAERRRRQADDSCIACHMPRYGASDIPHTALTDHRILRDPGGEVPAASRGGDGFPVVSFYRDRNGADSGEDDRDLGVALVKLALAGKADAVGAVPRVLDPLEAAVHRDPDDLAAGEAWGYALALRGQRDKALTAFEAVLGRSPDRERALAGAALVAEEMGRPDAARDFWRRAVAVDPEAADYRGRLARLLLEQQAWGAARAECDAWVRLDPFSAEARAVRVRCLLGEGKKDEARAEFASIEALAPDNLVELRARFERKLR